MPKPEEYVTMKCYCVANRHDEYLARDWMERAARENAPLDAVYFSHSLSKWVRITDLPHDSIIVRNINMLLAEIEAAKGVSDGGQAS